ncbi:MAG TPA: ABC transporter substrate-binding protein [Solirubrobacteraceae bacterium]|nr:ABC transporter substrate-binding protein [Solirubrobacteraceae bacterium]
MSRKTRLAVTGLISVVALVLAAATVSFGQSGGTDFVSYIGSSKKGAAKGSTIKIGYVNQQGGQVVIGANATDGAKAAVAYINQHGGIQGHKVQLVTCFIKSADEEGTTCGQKLGNDKNIKLIATGGVVAGIQSFYKALNGRKPVVTGVATTGVDGVQKNAVVLFGDSTHVLGPLGTYAKTVLKAKTAAVIYPNTDTVRVGAQAIIRGLQNAGVAVKSAAYAQGQADLSAPLAAANAKSADVVFAYSDASGCANQAIALQQIGYTDAKRIVSAPLCLNPMVSAALPSKDFPIWTYSIASSLYGDTTDKDMRTYMKIIGPSLTAAGSKANLAPDPWVIVDFGETLTAAKILNQVAAGGDMSKLTTANIVKALKAFKGPQALGAPALGCGKYSGAPSVCNDRTQFFTYEGKNKWKKASAWLQPTKKS